VPLERSPVGGDVCSTLACLETGKALPQYFAQPPSTQPVAYDITNYITNLVDDDVSAANRPPFALTVLPGIRSGGVPIPREPATLGFATFAPGPRLRLVLTANVERPQ
jgi:hypothetical protein